MTRARKGPKESLEPVQQGVIVEDHVPAARCREHLEAREVFLERSPAHAAAVDMSRRTVVAVKRTALLEPQGQHPAHRGGGEKGPAVPGRGGEISAVVQPHPRDRGGMRRHERGVKAAEHDGHVAPHRPDLFHGQPVGRLPEGHEARHAGNVGAAEVPQLCAEGLDAHPVPLEPAGDGGENLRLFDHLGFEIGGGIPLFPLHGGQAVDESDVMGTGKGLQETVERQGAHPFVVGLEIDDPGVDQEDSHRFRTPRKDKANGRSRGRS